MLCCCTGYVKIVEAVMEVGGGAGGVRPCGSDPMLRPPLYPGVRPAGSDPIVDPYVGARMARVDGWPKVAGTDKFGADEAPEGALHMRVVRSPHARATFALGDLDAVIAATPGLALILTSRDIPGHNSFGIFAHTRDQPVLAEGHVRFRGEAVLALVGTREAVETLSDTDLPIAWGALSPGGLFAERVRGTGDGDDPLARVAGVGQRSGNIGRRPERIARALEHESGARSAGQLGHPRLLRLARRVQRDDSRTSPASPSAKQRQAHRAPALRPPTNKGTPGHRARTAATAGTQQRSRLGGGPATFRPATSHGWR